MPSDTPDVTRVTPDLPCPTGRRPSSAAETGAVVAGWLIKLTLVLAVIGLVAHDAISIGVTSLRLPDDATRIATAARTTLDAPGGTPAKARAAGRRAALEAGYALERGDIVVDRGVVTVVLRDTADTYLVGRIPPLAPWGQLEGTGRVRSIHVLTGS